MAVLYRLMATNLKCQVGTKGVLLQSSSLLEIDNLTRKYVNQTELVVLRSLNKKSEVYIEYKYNGKVSTLPVTYALDDWNNDKLIQEYKEYLLSNKKSLKTFLKQICPALNGRPSKDQSYDYLCLNLYHDLVNNKDIDFCLKQILDGYFKINNPKIPYRRYRDVYFFLKESKQLPKTNIITSTVEYEQLPLTLTKKKKW